MSLLSIFDTVTVESDSFLTPEDIAHCEQLQKDYHLTREQLRKSLEFLKNSTDEFKVKGRILTEKFSDELFYPPLDEISDTLNSLHEIFVKEVVGYINRTYCLNFSADKCLKTTSYNDIVKVLLKGSEDGFFEQGLKLAIANFKSSAFTRKKNTIKGNLVTLDNYSLSNYSWEFVSEYQDPYKNLIAAASWIETKTLHPFKPFVQALNSKTKPSSEWIPSGGSILTGFKLYYNKRIDLQFATPEAAYEFFTTMQLGPSPA